MQIMLFEHVSDPKDKMKDCVWKINPLHFFRLKQERVFQGPTCLNRSFSRLQNNFPGFSAIKGWAVSHAAKPAESLGQPLQQGLGLCLYFGRLSAAEQEQTGSALGKLGLLLPAWILSWAKTQAESAELPQGLREIVSPIIDAQMQLFEAAALQAHCPELSLNPSHCPRALEPCPLVPELLHFRHPASWRRSTGSTFHCTDVSSLPLLFMYFFIYSFSSWRIPCLTLPPS